jgi:DHA1 family multidrug resistance protein-like MFS transporter
LSRHDGKKSGDPAEYSVLTFIFPGGEMSRVSQARSLGKYFLLVDNMLVVLGFFVVFPLISIRFVDQWAGLPYGRYCPWVAAIRAARTGRFGGAIADRFGAKPMIVTGMLMRAAGFATMGVAHEPGCCGAPAYSPDSAARSSIRRARRWWSS